MRGKLFCLPGRRKNKENGEVSKMDISNAVIAVTGASSGIGKECARRLCSRGRGCTTFRAGA